MWAQGWRDEVWSQMDQPWDLVVVGGGITGAGILLEAARAGWRVLLVEQNDFAWGTSSRSSKLVHGGFRYLKSGQVRMTYESVRERERLMREGRGLVNPLGFLLVSFDGDSPPAWVYGAGLAFYDLLAFKWGHSHYDAFDVRELCPPLRETGLHGGYRFFDAQTDDSRLVLRVIREGVHAGGLALNYCKATGLLRTRNDQVQGIIVEDQAPDSGHRQQEILAHQVINATGAWADGLRSHVGGYCRLRKLRGSHLLFQAKRVPLSRAVSFAHPLDQRPVFIFPWEGATLVGTTDVDYGGEMGEEPCISRDESEYLLAACRYIFPDLELDFSDILSTFAGIRPVVDTGKKDPCKESREHVIWLEDGLLTVAGGKLTTFRVMADDALKVAARRLGGRWRVNRKAALLGAPSADADLPSQLKPSSRMRLAGRYGPELAEFASSALSSEFEPVGGTPTHWAELRWAARAEGMIHLDDLLLRRTRLGHLLPGGGKDCLEEIREIVQPELGWDDERWEQEAHDYTKLWRACFSSLP